jgi:hypothetical protein
VQVAVSKSKLCSVYSVNAHLRFLILLQSLSLLLHLLLYLLLYLLLLCQLQSVTHHSILPAVNSQSSTHAALFEVSIKLKW